MACQGAPHIDSATDPTIPDVEGEERSIVRDFIAAAWDLRTAKDKTSFEGYMMFTRGHTKQANLEDVEAACVMTFHHIILACRQRYRGSAYTNKFDTKNTDRQDETNNCQVRVKAVEKALREWKSTAKDILSMKTRSSVWRIRPHKGTNPGVVTWLQIYGKRRRSCRPHEISKISRT
jgi:hypothetical protein